MFLEESDDYRTVWKLAHQWENISPDETTPTSLPFEVRQNIHRTLSAIANKVITARNKKRLIFDDKDGLDFFFFEFFNYIKIWQVQIRSIYDVSFLDSVYVKRAEVLRWCQNDFIEPPIFWAPLTLPVLTLADTQSEVDEGTHWYDEITPLQKKKVACLELAKNLWAANPELSYEEVFRHRSMKQYGNPEVFSLNSFKKWAREFAPEAAKTGGRPKESNSYDQLRKSKSP